MHSDDELAEGLLKDHREHPLEVRPESVMLGANPSTDDLRRARRKSRMAPLVLAATGVVCVAGLVALWPEHAKNQSAVKGGTPSPTTVASATVSMAEWRLDEVGKLLPVFMDDGAMKSGDYRTNDLSAQTFCPSMVKDVTKAMADSRPAPDDQVQKHFANMLTDYKEAGDKCVAGDMDGSWLALQAGEKEQEAVSPKK